MAISVLQQVNESLKGPQALILTPTRELALQVQSVIVALGDFMNIECHASFGYEIDRKEISKLQEGVHVVTGTPARLYALINRGVLLTDDVKICCLDMADETLSYSSKEQIYTVRGLLPQGTQVILSSTTMRADVLNLSSTLMRDPVHILVKTGKTTFEGISQYYIQAETYERKLDTLCDLHETITTTRSVVFCNTGRKAQLLAKELSGREFSVFAMHGDMEQNHRKVLMKEFHWGSRALPIITGLLVREIDFNDVSTVINYDLPTHCEDYIHRIGRGGQLGRKLNVINLITLDDVRMLHDIESMY